MASPSFVKPADDLQTSRVAHRSRPAAHPQHLLDAFRPHAGDVRLGKELRQVIGLVRLRGQHVLHLRQSRDASSALLERQSHHLLSCRLRQLPLAQLEALLIWQELKEYLGSCVTEKRQSLSRCATHRRNLSNAVLMYLQVRHTWRANSNANWQRPAMISQASAQATYRVTS